MTAPTDLNDLLPTRSTSIGLDGKIRTTLTWTRRLPALVTAGPALPDLEAMTRRIAAGLQAAAGAAPPQG